MDFEIDNIVDVNYLMDIIENHNDINTRVKALVRLDKFNNLNMNCFQFFESLVVSDNDKKIRAIAIGIIIRNYLKRGYPLIEWLIKNDKSVYVIHAILKAIKNTNSESYRQLNKILFQRYQSIYGLFEKETKFFMDLEFLFCKIPKNFKLGGFNLGGDTLDNIEFFNREVDKVNYFEVNGRVILLRLEQLELEKIPKSIGNLTKLRKLKLSQNNLSELPKEIENLQRLKYLDIHDNKFTEIPKVIIRLKCLKYLWLERNRISTIHDYVIAFVRNKIMKKYINRGFNESDAEIMGVLDIFLGGTKNMRKFNDPEAPFDYAHFGTGINIWYYKIDKLGHIIGLAFKYSNIQVLLEYISQLKHLKILYILNCEIKSFPKAFKNLINLKKLYFNKCGIDRIPAEFRKFKNLEQLSLRENNIRKIPKFIGEFRNLKSLVLSQNSITRLNKSLNKLKALERLSISGNKIKKIPKSILNLKSLEIY